MLVSDFQYDLPPERIAQEPLADRSGSRLLHLHRRDQSWQDRSFREFPDLLRSGDLLVVNNTRVFRARLFGHRSGQRAQPVSSQNRAARDFLRGRIEVLLTRQVAEDPNEWECLVRPGRKIGIGEKLYFGSHSGHALNDELLLNGAVEETGGKLDKTRKSPPQALKRNIFSTTYGTTKVVPFPKTRANQSFSAACEAVPFPKPIYETSSSDESLNDEPVELEAEVTERGSFGERRIRFAPVTDFFGCVERIGHVPLPPYIDRDDGAADRERYQTVYARTRGSVAAPTAGLHFTPGILERIRARGMEIAEITLHVGLGTFQPVRVEKVEDHKLHREWYEIAAEAAQAINRAKAEGRRVVAVGTTTVRTLEYAAGLSAQLSEGRVGEDRVEAGRGEAD